MGIGSEPTGADVACGSRVGLIERLGESEGLLRPGTKE